MMVVGGGNEKGGGDIVEVKANVLDRQFLMYQAEYEERALAVLRKGWYVLGDEVKNFEQEFADYVGAKHCVALASGLDALWISMRLLGIGAGDEVIVQGNAYIACVMGITMNGATPVFVEPNEYYNIDVEAIEAKITERTKAVLVVHLYGQAADMTALKVLANRHGVRIIEDCAQSHGAQFSGRTTGTFGDAGCFSFYPSKNLGCFGDGGAIVTDDDELAYKIRVFRNYGSQKRYYNEVVGTNSRLDELQAALLRVKLTHLDELTAERTKIANAYLQRIKNRWIRLPEICNGATHVWHLFVIRCAQRDRFIEHMKTRGVECQIHYPIPPHLSQAYEYLGLKEGALSLSEAYAKEVVSLPVYNGMTEQELDYVIETINNFAG